jgi:hypothetical protein
VVDLPSVAQGWLAAVCARGRDGKRVGRRRKRDNVARYVEFIRDVVLGRVLLVVVDVVDVDVVVVMVVS